MEDSDFDMLTMEEYIALTRDNQRSGVVCPELNDDIDFEISCQFMRELRQKLFTGTNDEDAHLHVRRVLEIADLFHTPGVTQDALMLRVFPITLTGAARRWMKMLPAGSINTWNLLEKAFIRRYYPPSKIAKKMEEIRSFRQKMDETLDEAWERYNDLLYRCPTHDISNHQMVLIFYKGLNISSRQMLDSQGPIPTMPPAQALRSIEMMADHSRNWYDGATTWVTNSKGLDDIGDITKQIDGLGCDMNMVKEDIHAIQEHSLREERKEYEQVKYVESLEEAVKKFSDNLKRMHDSNDEMIREFKEGADLNLKKLDAKRKSLEAKLEELNQKVLESKKNAVGTIKATVGKMKEVNKEPVPRDLPYIRPYVPPIPFPGRLKTVRKEETSDDQLKKMEAKNLQSDEATPQANEESTTTQNGITSNSSFIPNNLACFSIQDAEIMDEIVQPITSPDNGYVASATEPTLVDLAK